MSWPKRKWLDDEIEESVLSVIRYYREQEEDLPSQSHFEEVYCQNFVNYQGIKGHADAVNSGTSALFVAIAALGAKPEDEIISSPVTDFGSISAIILHGLKIRIADSCKNNFNTSLHQIQNNYSPLVKGIVLTHSAGDPILEIEEITKFCRQKNIWLIEDCSQAHGAMIGNRKVGTFGDIAIFSTMHSKNHSTGGSGGILYTQSKKIYNSIRSHADRGKLFHQEKFNPKDPECIAFAALNFNSNEISCAIGNTNLRKLDKVISQRRNFLHSLKQRFEAEDLPFALRMNIESSSPYFCPIEIKNSSVEIPHFKKKLHDLELPCNSHYSFIVKEWKWAKDYIVSESDTPNAVNFRNKSFNLLFNENFSKNEEDKIIQILKEALRNAS